MQCVTFAACLLTGAALVVGNQHYTDSSPISHLDDSPSQVKALEQLFPHHQQTHSSDEYCHGSQGRKEEIAAQYPWQNLLESVKNDAEYGLEYPEALEDYVGERLDYPEQDQRQAWQKRSSASPFISLGALSNLQQFFEQLKGTMDRLDEQQGKQQYQAQAAETERAFRPPATAAVLHAFRNYRPLRRTRSFPPALVHG